MLTFINKWFGKKKKVVSDIQTAPLSYDQLEAITIPQLHVHPTQMLAGYGQSNGMQRDHNEDTLFGLSSVLADGLTDLPFGIFVVADGMGGHQNGEIASGIAARTVASFLISRLYGRFIDTGAESGGESMQEIMESAVQEAQRAVIRKAPGGGTTLTAALIVGEQVTIAHVGDSRAYFIYPDGRMIPITKDHSLVHRMVELGELTEEEAKVHPNRNVLLRAVGQLEPFRPDIYTHQLPRPGYLLLCSDGLWGLVPDTEMFRIIKTANSPAQACDQLIEAANAAGGPDNITAILVHFLT